MRNSGRTAKSTLYGSSALILNILLNAILIFGLFGFPQMGIKGAAFATTISRAVELLLTIFENRKTGVVRVKWKYFHSVRLKRDYYRYTMPVLAVYFLLNLDELVKLPAVYRHYKQYKWVKNLTANQQ